MTLAPLVIQDLLELPRPGAGVPNSTGTLALLPSTTFSFQENRTSKTISLVDLSAPDDAGPRTILTDLHSNAFVWLDETTFLFTRLPGAELQRARGIMALVNGDSPPPPLPEGAQRIDHRREVSDKAQAELVSKARELSEGGKGVTEIHAMDVLEGTNYLVGTLSVTPGNLKLNLSKKEGAVLAFSAAVFPDGDPWKVAEHEKKRAEKARGSDIRVYDSLFVRHWDTWTDTEGVLQQVHFVRLSKGPETLEEDGFQHVDVPDVAVGKWTFVGERVEGLGSHNKRPVIHSPLAGTKLECPVGPFGSASDFDLSGTHIVFHAKDPHVNPAWHTRTQVYIVPLSPKSDKDAAPRRLTVGTQAACSSPTFSDDGSRIAWLEMREDGYEADRNRVMVYELESGERKGWTEEWDRSPSSITWCPCGEKLYLLATEAGHTKLFTLSVPLSDSSSSKLAAAPKEPKSLTKKGNITSVSPLSTHSVLLTSSAFTTPNYLSTLSVSTEPTDSLPSPELAGTLVPSLAKSTYLCPGEEFWFSGALGREVHGFILWPQGAKDSLGKAEKGKGKKWPLAFLVHGGPQSAWEDSWSTRWNPNIYASQGYITVAINPTGSTGYGQKFCDDIKNQWGGLPYQDLLAGLEFIKTAFPEIDADRTAMLGASYGGFMANWIQGHNDTMGFKAIVCHDGVFSTTNTFYSTEELYFPEREFGGKPWETPETYARWNPQNHISKWKTPQLVIHSAKDYRLTESEGLGVFNTLQRLGIPSRFVHFPSENHWVLEPHNGVRWHEEVLRWIDEWTAKVPDLEDSAEE